MARNKLSDLRDHMFEVLERLKDGDMDVKTAGAAAQVGGVLVEVAKLEYNALKDLGGKASFLSELEVQRQLGENQAEYAKPEELKRMPASSSTNH
jgi:hypothetical protein